MFIDTLQDCVLHHITEPILITWYRQGVNLHALDLVLTDEERMVDELRYLAALGKGDHLLAKLITNCCTSQRITYHNWSIQFLMDSGIKWELYISWPELLDPLVLMKPGTYLSRSLNLLLIWQSQRAALVITKRTLTLIPNLWSFEKS